MSNPPPLTLGPSDGVAEPAEAPPSVAPPGRPGLADWLDLLALLRRDEGMPDGALRRRDRAIGARIEADPARPERWLVAWVRTQRASVGASDEDDGAPGLRTAEAVRWVAALLGAGGLALGTSAALGAFAFQPQGRINVVAVLGVLVVLPGLFLGMALLNALPTGLRRMLPFVGSEPEGGGVLQPARWALRVLPRSAREALESAWARGRGMERLAAPVQRWLLLSASQGAALAFQLGALGTALALVVFSDLSFGWSTTLDVGAEPAHRVTRVLSAPWARFWPEAVPSAELIADTRFFRIASQTSPVVEPERFGEWWRFVVMAIAVYGLLPRLCFFVYARARLRRGLVRAVRDAPGSRRLLARMRAPLVETARAGEGESAAAAPDPWPEESAEAFALGDWPERAVVVGWADAAQQARADLRAGAAGPLLAAGGRLPPTADAEAAAEAGRRARAEDLPVAVAVRGFEPPVLEFVDLLRELRRALGDGREIVVGLVGGDAAHLRAWRRKLAGIGDPWIACSVLEASELRAAATRGRTTGDVPDPAETAPDPATGEERA